MSNKLYYGDNLEVLRKYIKDETIDLCYIDPPFNSNRNYNQIYLNEGEEDKAQAHAFTDTWMFDDVARIGYEEIINNDKNRFNVKTILLIEGLAKVLGKESLLAYLIHITLRVVEIHRVLKRTGSFYLHCDPTSSHYLKLVIDTIFVTEGGGFRNEILWYYYNKIHDRRKKLFPRATDTIFFYVKDINSNFTYHQLKEQRDSPIKQLARKKVNGKMVNAKGADGKVIYNIKEDRTLDNVWRIPCLQPAAPERLGYQTQKPEELLERVINASTNEGDLVLDAYCGCGTTVTVAERLKRKWIGIDITYQSISLILWRLENRNGKLSLQNIELNGAPKDWESAKLLAEKSDDKTRKEFEKWAVLFYSNNKARINEKKGADGGIDGISLIQERNLKTDIENKKIIFSVKSDKTLLPAYINQLKGKMHDNEIVMGVFICLYEPTRGMIKEAKEMGNYKNNLFNMEYPRLQIVTVKEMFDENKRLNIPVLEQNKKAEKAETIDKDQHSLF